jgi:general stress protein YciG
MPDAKKQRAGRKGGEAVSKNREHMSAIGRKGGQRSKSSRSGNGAKSKPAESAQNAVELLKADHQEVNSLFKEHEMAGGEDRNTIAEKIMMELEIHAKIEEEIFYPAFRAKADDEGKDLVAESIEEHQQVKDLIKELKTLDPEDETYDEKFQDLKQDVTHHVEEEEGEMFPSAEEFLGEQLDQLGVEMEKRKQQLLETVSAQ